MASDILFDECAVDTLDMNNDSDIFITGGLMNPKELYLTDLVGSKDASSSSDSGFSTLDDFQDMDNVTDLASLMESELKDIDFNLDFNLSKLDQDDVFDPVDLLVKKEPKSPSPTLSSSPDGCCLQQPISPDIFSYHNDLSLKEEGSPLTLPMYHHQHFDHDGSSSPSSVYSFHQSYIMEPSTSPSLSPSSPSSSYSNPNSPPATQYVHQPKQDGSSPFSVTAYGQQQPASPPAPQYIVVPNIHVPQVKREVTSSVSILSPRPGFVIQPGSDTKLASSFNIDTILSSKIKIKPKPGSDIVSPPAGVHWITTTSSQVPFTSQSIPVMTSSSLISGGVTAVPDEKNLKRAQRIIKNRESASLSRKRKKEYLNSLEERLQQCKEENDRLLKENETLRRQVEYLQNENVTLKHPSGLSPVKKMCLLCIGLLLTLNLSPLSILNNVNTLNSAQYLRSPGGFSGRHLLSVPDDGDPERVVFRSGGGRSENYHPSLLRFDEELSLLAERLNLTDRIGNMCPMFFNSTESVRKVVCLDLSSTTSSGFQKLFSLTGEGAKEEKKKNKEKKHKKKKNYPPVKHFGSNSFGRYTQSVPNSEVNGPAVNSNTYPIQVFSGAYDSRQRLLNAIHRRNDTFYVLSFSTDYFLVPATAHNKTMRPRMSLLMPVVTPLVNGSSGDSRDSVGMMQIDCEILNTNLIQVQRSVFPEKSVFNSTAFESGQEKPANNNGTRPQGRKSEKYWEKLQRSNK
uniref:BZIP domain-containing protein n=1 Tax=Biomphalaria glabrata TaxID=6526 RepID=A0A2C9LDA5_BIOGL